MSWGIRNYEYYWQKAKWVNNTFVVFQINKNLTGMLVHCNISSQQALNNLQQAFNEMQKDLEVLKEYENEN